MGSPNNTMNGNGDRDDLFIPYCTREPCHLDSQGASLFLDDSGEYSKLKVGQAYVTGGGITHPILNAGVCVDDMINAGYTQQGCLQQKWGPKDWRCTTTDLIDFAEFLASDFFDDPKPDNECYKRNIDFRQATFLNSITSAHYAELMGFKAMTVLSELPDSWDRSYNGLVLSFSSTKVELFNDTSDLAKASYPDSYCKNTGIYYILDEECIKGTMEALKADYDSNNCGGCDNCGHHDTLNVVASAGARNGIKHFLSSTKELNFFTDQFSSVCSEVAKLEVEVVSGEKEAFLGMGKMVEALQARTDIPIEWSIPVGYLDFGGNSVQPSFWLGNNTIFPSELKTEVKLNSFLNYGADAVKYRVSQMYLVLTRKYQGVCDIGPELDIDLCHELIECISLGCDLKQELQSSSLYR